MRWIRLLLLSALFLSIPTLMKRDFKLPPTYIDRYPSNPKWETPAPQEELLSILNQPFLYFAHGNQSTVFASQDGKYVLKLFRYKRSLFPLLHNCKNWFKKKPKQSLVDKLEKTFNATHLAYTEASPFTQVIYCHLNLTQRQLPVIELQAGRKYEVPLDQYRFVLQRKVASFKETLLAAREDPEKMGRLLDSFLQLLINRSSLNIRNSDPNLGPNFGFLGEQAVELDFGNYHKISPNPEMRRQEIENLVQRLEEWLGVNAPEYVNDLRLKSAISYSRLSQPPLPKGRSLEGG